MARANLDLGEGYCWILWCSVDVVKIPKNLWCWGGRGSRYSREKFWAGVRSSVEKFTWSVRRGRAAAQKAKRGQCARPLGGSQALIGCDWLRDFGACQKPAEGKKIGSKKIKKNPVKIQCCSGEPSERR